jgi:hypothetical protein
MFQLTPQTKLRVTFYLVFTCLGLFHAEVLSRSSPWVLLNPLMFLLVAPVYACHYVVLGDLLLRRRATSFFPVFVAGCILGMYEFVITKVFWTPTWTPFAPRVLETSWAEVIWVGFWWHAFMSFAIPFFLVRKLVLESHPHPFQIREVRWVVLGVPLMAATFGVAFGGNAIELLGTVLLSLVVIFAVARFFMKKAPQWGFKSADDVLLGPTGRKRALAFLVLVYVFYGATMRLGALPSLVGLILPVLLYAVLFLIFVPLIRPRPTATEGPAAAPAAAAVAPSAPMAAAPEPAAALPVLPDVPAPLPMDGLRHFLVRYALVFAGLILACAAIGAVAPWILFILYIGFVLQGGVGAVVFLVAAGAKVLKARFTERRAVPSA